MSLLWGVLRGNDHLVHCIDPGMQAFRRLPNANLECDLYQIGIVSDGAPGGQNA